ncbi:MAG: DUF2141 domain-containing protein [Kordiimonadaceae bacterium]|nr:DUF2141 domain-containing protein [Kordiimonadaceae bacterium]
MFASIRFSRNLTLKTCCYLFGCAVILSSSVAVQAVQAACAVGETGTALRVDVSNIRYLEGNLRAQIYGDNPDDFLAKGKKLFRLDVPVTNTGEQTICVPMPGTGTYALVIMHDRNKNGKADFFSEGFGFSNNPKLRFAPPDAEDVMIKVDAGVLDVPVKLFYILGSDIEEGKRRRKMHRR